MTVSHYAVMSVLPGTRFGPYEVLSALGTGGMGEEWQSSVTGRQSSGLAARMTVVFGRPTDDSELTTDAWVLKTTSAPESHRWR
jgi:hypothetical protein